MRSDDGPRAASAESGGRSPTVVPGAASTAKDSFLLSPPVLSLPKGGGAIRGLGEKFAANPVTGTGSMTVPIATSPGRSGFGPQLSLAYDSGAGNGPFGLGWNLSLPNITRKTDKGLARYRDAEESDVFILSGAEDLVPVLLETDGNWSPESPTSRTVGPNTYAIRRYRPRIEGLFARIERWTNIADATDVFWRSISKENVTTWYGRTPETRILDPAEASRIFSWLICESYDGKGNVISYRYKAEDDAEIDLGQVHERNRTSRTRGTQRYLKHILYGNWNPYFPKLTLDAPRWPQPPDDQWFFDVVFDYGEHDAAAPTPTGEANPWQPRNDPFSTYRSGFEVRTYRLCKRVLMFHRFPAEAARDVEAVPGFETSCVVRSTDFSYADRETDTTEPDGDSRQDPEDPNFSFLRAVTQTGYRRRDDGTYASRSLPPVEMVYSEPVIDETIRELDAESYENLPSGIDGSRYQWVDLEGVGLSGVLTEQAGCWFYKRNLGPINLVTEAPGQAAERALAKLAPIELIGAKPNVMLGPGGGQLMDLSGDGRLDVVMLDGPIPGFFEQDEDGGWNPFRPFTSGLNRSTADPNLRLVDLDGDGHADVLITENDVLTWHHSLDVDGFGPAEQVAKARDEEEGPALVFADGTQSIYLADFSGDGLSDLVRIRNGEICYWPNLGYGRFGAKVTMDDAPWFDAVDAFDQRRVHLADIDGSGTTDIVYLHADGPRLYFNRSGNRWSPAVELSLFPRTDSLAGVTVVDLLGNGTACLVWSSSLPGGAAQPLRYIDLMGGQKPHLLVSTRNNLGGETRVEYAPSTKFYLLDERAGTPWITRLPFPVHVVERVTVTDEWRRTSYTTTYKYHHAHYDGYEREFRGFGRVEQIDVEAFTAADVESPFVTNQTELQQAPVKTVTWFHTGAFLDRERILSHFADEYFPKPFPNVRATFAEKDLPDPDLDAQDLTVDEWREALRACKGMPLRQEIYELDMDALAAGEERPVKLFSAAQHSCEIQCLQPLADNRHAVFLVTEAEAITYHHELDLTAADVYPDPRVAHTMNLRVDPFGRALQSVAAVYPRLGTQAIDGLSQAALALIAQVQSEPHLAYTETRYTDDDFADAADTHRIPLPYEVSTYELTGIRQPTPGLPESPAGGDIPYWSIEELRGYQLSEHYQPTVAGLVPVASLEYQVVPDGTRQKRIVEWVRTRYFADAGDTGRPTDALALGKHGPRGLKYQDYKLALTDGLLNDVFQRRDANGDVVDLLARPLDATVTRVRDLLDVQRTSGYVKGDVIDPAGATADPRLAHQYWMASGVAGFDRNLPFRFFLPDSYTDSFGNFTGIVYDDRGLFVQSSVDARLNRIAVTAFDYRVLAPREMLDPSGNYAALAFDILGMPVASAVMGKNGTESGDTVAVDTDPPIADIARFLTQPFDKTVPIGWLGKATARFIYDLGEQTGPDGKVVAWGERPAAALHILREQHVSVAPPGDPAIQIAVAYSDGFGAAIVKKAMAEPDPESTEEAPPLRWIASGKNVLNKKGQTVKKFEPYLSGTEHRFDPTEAEREIGVTVVMYYDGPGRLVRTDLPDGTFSRVVFSPWHVESFDPNDTVRSSLWYQSLSPPDPAGHLPNDMGTTTATPDQRAAWLAARCDGTPAITVLDSLGREVVAIAHNRVEDPAGTLTFDGRTWRDDRYLTFTKLDAEGKPLWIRDALGHLVMQYLTPPRATDAADEVVPPASVPGYDIAGNLLFQHSMDAGDRRMLTDAAGKPMLAWDFNEAANTAGDLVGELRLYVTDYDNLHRPIRHWLKRADDPKLAVERFEYQDAQPNDINNLNGQAARHYDPSGLAETVCRDFQGNVLTVRRTLTADGTVSVVDWQTLDADGTSKLTDETFTQVTEYDALSRITLQYNWHRADDYVAAYTPKYGQRGVLTSENLLIGAARTPTGPTGGVNAGKPDAIGEVRYNVKGQKELVRLGNGTITTYEYDQRTFRLTRLRTQRPLPPRDACSSAFIDPTVIQDLQYTYDPVGNIAQIIDAAQKTAYGNNQRIDPINRYEYDPIYRLTVASGKESGAATGAPTNLESTAPEAECPAPDPAALRNYIQLYTYDPGGNIKRMRHMTGDIERWTRDYTYAYEAAGQTAGQPSSNRLYQTTTDTPDEIATYGHDTHGNMLNLGNVAAEFTVQWDHRDMIRRINLGGGGTSYYQYDADKQCTRKLIVDHRDKGGCWERIYLGGYELYRRSVAGAVVEEVESQHLFEGEQRMLLVDDVLSTDNARLAVSPLFRYQYSNHLESSCLELKEDAAIISYEEYHPYGTTAYLARHSAIETPQKRYRYIGMERDDDSGLCRHGIRFYSPALGRWTTADVSDADGLNRYAYSRNNPIVRSDRNGYQSTVSAKRLTQAELVAVMQPLFERTPLEEKRAQPVVPAENSADASPNAHDLLKFIVDANDQANKRLEAFAYGLKGGALEMGGGASLTLGLTDERSFSRTMSDWEAEGARYDNDIVQLGRQLFPEVLSRGHSAAAAFTGRFGFKVGPKYPADSNVRGTHNMTGEKFDLRNDKPPTKAWREISGEQTAEQKGQGWPGQLSSHTEAKTVAREALGKYFEFLLKGEKRPCWSCRKEMKEKVRTEGGNMVYETAKGRRYYFIGEDSISPLEPVNAPKKK